MGITIIGSGGGGSSYDQSLNTTDNVEFNSVSLPNTTQITVGSFDNMTGGASGISLHCAVGYELNWQGGRLRSIQIGDTNATPQAIYCDSPLTFNGTGVSAMQIGGSGLTFPDGTTQATAATATTDASLLTTGTLDIARLPAVLEKQINHGSVTSTEKNFYSSSASVHTATINANVAVYIGSGSGTTIPPAGSSVTLILKQGGAFSVTWQNSYIRWPAGGAAPTLTGTVNRTDIFTFVSDGTLLYGSVVQGY